jgi:NTP pyrophosphatase (non-canonical NTP hydrolase)
MQLDDFQQLMADTFGERDRARGVDATIAWLAEELGELARAVRKGTRDEQLHEVRHRSRRARSGRPTA